MARVGLVAVLAGCGGSARRTVPPPVPPDVHPRLVEETYPVEGSTVRAIRRALDARGPVWRGRRVYGLTRWQTRWSWRYQDGPGWCRLTALNIELDVTVTLPAWKPMGDPPPELETSWRTFLANLRAHEDGHRDLAYEAARAVRAAIRDVRTPTCANFTAVANQRARAIVDRYEQLNVAYDEDTGRGRTQGVRWPPVPWTDPGRGDAAAASHG